MFQKGKLRVGKSNLLRVGKHSPRFRGSTEGINQVMIYDHINQVIIDDHINQVMIDDHINQVMIDDHIDQVMIDDHIDQVMIDDHINQVMIDDHINQVMIDDHFYQVIIDDHINEVIIIIPAQKISYFSFIYITCTCFFQEIEKLSLRLHSATDDKVSRNTSTLTIIS